MNVLFVEDDPILQVAYAEAAAEWGWRAVVAGTLAEARATVGHFSPDVVVLDGNLPDGNGASIAPTWSSTAVILAVMGDAPERSLDDMRLVAHAVFRKPVSFQRLRAAVETPPLDFSPPCKVGR